MRRRGFDLNAIIRGSDGIRRVGRGALNKEQPFRDRTPRNFGAGHVGSGQVRIRKEMGAWC